ncbi:MAG: 4-(cytidine 5'-diphospho)-2-C-methyl-D-erythritol kinase [Desulfobulbales bacterium]|nr:4-(cytidine 5'-diphospho)-2-C-methyl-D-erythritol kinase [Desulfobulbales bacterium]
MKEARPTRENSRLTLKAPAKINLFLKVLQRRPDGYHEIESALQKVTLFDTLYLARQEESIAVSCPGGRVPDGEENLVYKAAGHFFAASGIKQGIRIVLEKKIPVAAGLGGGSSDAAAVLHGLNRLFGAGLGLEQLKDIGLQLGADVPFFVENCSGAIATSIGECLQEFAAITAYWIVLVNPGFAVSTKWVYENFPLTSYANPYILARDRDMPVNIAHALPGLIAELGNDLEEVTIKHYPEIGAIKKDLKRAGAVAALMSGSGPTVFGLFTEKKDAQKSYLQYQKAYGDSVFLVRPYIP